MKKCHILLCFSLYFTISLGCKKNDTVTQEDLCEGVICLNGGSCVNGSCNCPIQWTGPDCSQEKPPEKMRVGRIKLSSFPTTDSNGAGWDLFDGPDVYIEISQGNEVLFTSNFVEDLIEPYEWTVNFEFSDPTATYVISVYDYDDGITADDFMGGIQFTPYRPGERFPETMILDCGNCVVSFVLSDVLYFHV